jgi:predicted ATP-grasp superfamily ATP-dependent carboligase
MARVKSLTIVGSSARAAATSAVRAGFSVRAGDLFADADLRRVADAARVADYPRGLTAVVGGDQAGPRMYTGALENHPALVDRWARLRPLWGNPGAVVKRVRNARLVAAALRAAGLSAPATTLDPRRVPRDGTWLVKPRRSAGGARIGFFTDACAASGRSRDVYFQQFVEGMPCSAVYVAARGRATLLGVTRQLVGQAWAGAAGFRYCGSVGPIEPPGEAAAQFAKVGDVLANAFGLIGLFGIDAIASGGAVWPVEVNPRYPASVEILERAGGVQAIAAHAKACEDGRLPRQPTAARRAISGKAILFAAAPLTILAAWTDWALSTTDQSGPMLADIPAGGTTIEAGWPIVTIFAEAEDARDVVTRLRTAASSVLATIAAAP